MEECCIVTIQLSGVIEENCIISLPEKQKFFKRVKNINVEHCKIEFATEHEEAECQCLIE